jgi:hypothetical protein
LNPKLFSQMSVTLLSVQQDPKLKDNKITKLHYLSNTALLKIKKKFHLKIYCNVQIEQDCKGSNMGHAKYAEMEY